MMSIHQMPHPKACKSEKMVLALLSIKPDGLKIQIAIAVFTDPWQRGCVSSVPLILSLLCFRQAAS